MTQPTEPQEGRPKFGKAMVYVGVVMLATSIILAFAGVSGAGFHNFLQFGGIALMLFGYLVWKVAKL